MNFSSNEIVLFAIATLLLLLLNASFVAVEFSLVKLRYTRFGTGRMKEARQSKPVAALLDDMSGSIKLVRLGIVMCTIGLGFVFALIAQRAFSQIDMGSSYAWLAWVGGFLAAVVLHFTLGEIVPRSLALQHPVQSLNLSLPWLAVFRVLTKPLSVFLGWVSGGLLRVMRLDPSSDLNLLDVEAQIRSMISEGDELPEFAENIVSNALDLRKRVAHDIMIPRNQLRYLDLNDSIQESLEIAKGTGHTRFPLCIDGLDDCVGIIHTKDVFRSKTQPENLDLKKIKRPMLRFSMDESLERVLQRFLKQKKHFALLSDDFGGTVGAVTLEDVLEELVGEIQDEFDNEMELISSIDDETYVVDGLTPLHDLSEVIGIELEADEVSTFGGYITFELGRMPEENETFRIGQLEITATNMDMRRVIAGTVRVVPEEQLKAADEEEAESD